MKVKLNVFCQINHLDEVKNLKDTLTNIAPELDTRLSKVYVISNDEAAFLKVRNEIGEWLTVGEDVIGYLCEFRKKPIPPIPNDNGLLFVYDATSATVSGDTIQALVQDMLYHPTAGFIIALSPDLNVSYRYANRSSIYLGGSARLSSVPERDNPYTSSVRDIDYPPMGIYLTRNSTFLEYDGNIKKMAKGLCLKGYLNFLDTNCSFKEVKNAKNNNAKGVAG